jgi:hypothetical protein
MNILYIGPYNSSRFVSNASIDIIQSLESNEKVSDITIRPCFINGVNNNFSDNAIIQNLSRKPIKSHYDVIIQHCPVELLSPTYDNGTKNIAIPLFNRIINCHSIIEKLQEFELVLVDNDADAHFLNTHSMVKHLKVFDYKNMDPTISKNTNTMNIVLFKDHVKYYTILEDFDEELITCIVKSFYYALSQSNDFALVIFINSNDQSLNNKASELIKNINNQINYRSNQANVHIMTKQLSLDEICSIHNTCDIFLDLEISNYNSLNKYIVKKYNKPSIILDMVMSDAVPYQSNKSSLIGELIPKPGYSLLIPSMQNIISNKDKYISEHSHESIDEIICQ